MGEAMNKNLISIEFHKSKSGIESKFTSSISLQDFMGSKIKKNNDLSRQTKKASAEYEKFIRECKTIIGKVKKEDSINQASLKDMWNLGDKIHRFTNNLKKDGFYLDGLYEHLVRDLQVSRSLLEKVVIFRSHFPSSLLIPSNMLWKEVRDAPRKNAEKLKRRGLLNKKTKQK